MAFGLKLSDGYFVLIAIIFCSISMDPHFGELPINVHEDEEQDDGATMENFDEIIHCSFFCFP